MYVLHGARGSGSSIVEAALAELGAEVELRDLDARAHQHRGEGYAALNPHRKMPTLEAAGGELLTESVAILLTLDERHRSASLLPEPGSADRAQALRWLLFMATELYPIVEIIDYPERFMGASGAKEEIGVRAKEIWRERWCVVEGHVNGAPYLLPSGFCATDLFIAALSHWDLEPGWRAQHLPKVVALAKAVRARPAIAPVWARHFPRG